MSGDMNPTEETSIREFFNGRSVFITGATGFLGKFVLEKLLSTTNVSKIYFLIRSNKKSSIEERTEILKSDPLFKFRTPKQMLDRLEPVVGDISLENLGIEPMMKEVIENNVSIVIHIAATISFNEPLKNAMRLNVFGTNEVMKMCRNMKHLKSLIHVSTSYANANIKQNGEKYIPVDADPDILMMMTNEQDENIFKNDTFELYRQGHDTTYTFTKNLAEKLVKQECIKHSIPCTIVRPSLIFAPYDEQLEYYVDTATQAPAMTIINFALGLNRVFPGTKDSSLSVVPVDMAANMILVCAWKLAMEPGHGHGNVNDDDNGNIVKPRSFDPNIYGAYIDQKNQLSLAELNEIIMKAVKKYPPMKLVRPPNMSFFYPKNTMSHQVCHFFFNLVFAFVFDSILFRLGRKVHVTKFVMKSVTGFDTMTSFFIPWTNEGHSFPGIFKEMNVKDKHLFDCSIPNHISENKYVFGEKYWLSIRKWVLKDDIGTMRKARQNMFQVKIMYYIIMTLVLSPFLIAIIATTLMITKFI